ncbi:uncharacterized protein LOC130941663 [Arachis stenosperma]|uniref:uncharacterized protein LOC130941663 n=1 Tax=Arachis stenosperma TaxID=217475 RepID=UPI0025AC8302|nr:uncharacterized protein LOC130941663 [Arachis stenosperma]
MNQIKPQDNAAAATKAITPFQSDEHESPAIEISHESPVSGAGWVCKIPSEDSGWRSFNTKSSSQTHLLSAEEKSTIAALDLQLKAVKACKAFLVGNTSSDFDEDDIIDDEDEDEDEDEPIDGDDNDDEGDESAEYKFFEKVFKEDGELRRYYENNHKEGHFYCLVCGAVWKKVWKRFKDCNQLLQHSTTVLRTKRMRAHRAYAQVVCKVIGWDIDQLPVNSRKILVESKKSGGDGMDDSNGETDNGNADERVDDLVHVP